MNCFLPPSSPRDPADWPEDWDDENGKYLGKCDQCGGRFIGHKRRRYCRICRPPGLSQKQQFCAFLTRLADMPWQPRLTGHRAIEIMQPGDALAVAMVHNRHSADDEAPDASSREHARYLAHAANMLPHLVTALERIANWDPSLPAAHPSYASDAEIIGTATSMLDRVYRIPEIDEAVTV